jgi:hypothetical protein
MDARGGLGVIVGRKRCGVVAMVMTVLLASYAAVAAGKVSEPVDYVSPNIGTIGQLLTATAPYVQTPHGMARLAPITTAGDYG